MKILCLGDSITFGTGVSRGKVWTTLVQQRHGCQMINRGIPGDTSGGMLARYIHEVEQHRPQMVVLLGGGNDIFSSGDDRTARANLTAMTHQTSARALRPVVCTPLPIRPAEMSPEWRTFTGGDAALQPLAEYASWLRLFCKTFSIPFVDYWSVFAERGDGLYCDGVHPNAAGHILMADIFGQAMGTSIGANPNPHGDGLT